MLLQLHAACISKLKWNEIMENATTSASASKMRKSLDEWRGDHFLIVFSDSRHIVSQHINRIRSISLWFIFCLDQRARERERERREHGKSKIWFHPIARYQIETKNSRKTMQKMMSGSCSHEHRESRIEMREGGLPHRTIKIENRWIEHLMGEPEKMQS